MRLRLLPIVLALTAIPAIARADSVVTYHNSMLRHGAYTIPALTLAAAANVHRDTGFSASISGHVYAQPLYWKPKGTQTGLVIVVTESNIVYALDENTGATVWQTPLAPPMPLNQLPCGNIDPDGITGTPVIDPAAGVLYLNALTKQTSGPRHYLYALSLADGSILPKWPLDVQAKLTAKGVNFSSSTQGERSALLYFANRLFVNYGGNAGDCGTYFGTVIQLQTDHPKIEGSWQTRASGGGIWAQGGLAGDGTYLFITTGNTFGASQWMDGEAIIRLHPGLKHFNGPRDYFTPSNWKDLDNSDQDLGGTEAIPLNVATTDKPAKRVIAFGKDGNAYLVDRANLGGIGGQIQTLPVSGSAIRTAPAVYQTDSATMVAFTSARGGGCSGSNITMVNVAASGTTPMSIAWCAPFNGGGAPMITTTDGSADAIVWAVGAEGDNLLHGFNALNGQVVFGGSGTNMSGLHHFQTLIATDTRLYVGADGGVYAFAF